MRPFTRLRRREVPKRFPGFVRERKEVQLEKVTLKAGAQRETTFP